MKLKLKTRKAAAKRVKVKKNCICRKKAYKGHLLRRKNSKRLRHLSGIHLVHVADHSAFAHMLLYI
jgi:large subunit ribosomal protein L35